MIEHICLSKVSVDTESPALGNCQFLVYVIIGPNLIGEKLAVTKRCYLKSVT